MSIAIIGTGSHLPPHVVSNDDIEAVSADWDRERAGSTLHDWIVPRAGVATRHRVGPGDGTSTMAAEAGRRAMADAGVSSADVDLLVVGTFTPDHQLPFSSTLVQHQLGTAGKCLQLASACTGFIDGFITAAALLGTARHRTALVVHAEVTSSISDPDRFLSQSLFGDGAGAVVLRADEAEPEGLVGWCWHTDADLWDWTTVLADPRDAPGRGPYLALQSKRIFPYAVDRMVEAVQAVLAESHRTVDDVDLLVPHQAGRNIIGELVERLKLDEEQVVVTIERTGNVSGASIPIALDEANRAGRIRRGDRLVLPAVGAGMAWGAVHLTWAGTRSSHPVPPSVPEA